MRTKIPALRRVGLLRSIEPVLEGRRSYPLNWVQSYSVVVSKEHGTKIPI